MTAVIREKGRVMVEVETRDFKKHIRIYEELSFRLRVLTSSSSR